MNIAIDRQYLDYPKISRYSVYPVYYNIVDKDWESVIHGHLKQDTVYSYYEVKEGDTWDSLALYYYGNPTYYWILCDFNRVQDPFSDLVAGQTIKIPSFSDIEFEFLV